MVYHVYYYCPICGNLIEMVENSGVVPVCCGKPMEHLEAGTHDGSAEKHVPSVKCDGRNVTVRVGELPHPMQPGHYIRFVCLHTTLGCHRRMLEPDDEPLAAFYLDEEEIPLCAYEYCTVHGLWKKEMNI